MAVNQTISKILKTIESSIEAFQKGIPGIQKGMLEELLNNLKELKTNNGKVLNNVENLRLINQVKNKLDRIIKSQGYKDAVKEYAKAFDEVAGLHQQYFALFNQKFKPSKTLPIIKEMAVDQTVNGLLGQGLSVNIIDRIGNVLLTNITSGGGYAQLNEQLRNSIIGGEENEGMLERYSKTITTDAINQYSAQYHETIATDLQFSWGRYIGSNITTTREFCDLLTAKEWVHKSELPKIVEGDIDGHQCKLSKSTGLPLGMIPGTNADNFKVRRGGYNCGHQFFWVPDSAVPDEVKRRFENKEKAFKALKTNLVDDEVVMKRVKIDLDGEDEIKKVHSITEIINLTGGIPTDKFQFLNFKAQSFGYGVIKTEVTSDAYTITRNIDSKNKEIYNAYMKVHGKGEGTGTALFLNQVKEARKLGYKTLRVHAAGGEGWGEDWDGYYRWARLGYTLDPVDKRKVERFLTENNRKEKDLNELVSTNEGLNFWKENGFEWHGAFDLTDESANMNLLIKYLEVKKFSFEL